jgi:hypothetical protein
MTTKEELSQRLFAAQNQAHEAESELQKALTSYRAAVSKKLEIETAMFDGPPAFWLCDVVRANRSNWSGGPTGFTNLREAIIRDVAIGLMR